MKWKSGFKSNAHMLRWLTWGRQLNSQHSIWKGFFILLIFFPLSDKMFCFVTHISKSSTAPFFPFCDRNLNTKKPKCKCSLMPDVYKNRPLLITETPFAERMKLGSKGLNTRMLSMLATCFTSQGLTDVSPWELYQQDLPACEFTDCF